MTTMTAPATKKDTGKSPSRLQAAFAQMAQAQPTPERIPAFKITLYGSQDLMHFTAICNQVGSAEYDTPEDALAHALAAHTRMNRREMPHSLKRAIGYSNTKARQGKRELPHALKGALASPRSNPVRPVSRPQAKRKREGKNG